MKIRRVMRVNEYRKYQGTKGADVRKARRHVRRECIKERNARKREGV